MANVPVELAISLPFKLDSNGKVSATADQSKIWINKVRSVIGTSLGERIYRPNFGSEIMESVFDGDFNVISEIESQIEKAFQRHLPLVTLQDVDVKIEQESRRILVDIQFEIPQGGSFVTQFGLATIDGTNPIQEEVSWQSI